MDNIFNLGLTVESTANSTNRSGCPNEECEGSTNVSSCTNYHSCHGGINQSNCANLWSC